MKLSNKQKTVPRTWTEFLNTVSGALSTTSAPDYFVDSLSNEEISDSLFNIWKDIKIELDESSVVGENVTETWNELLDVYTEDIVKQIDKEISDSWNYDINADDETQLAVDTVSEELYDALLF